MSLKFGNLSIIDTTRTSITLQAHVNFTNPTNYSATVPYFNINILVNGTVLAQAIAEDVNVRPGNNTNILVKAVWDPTTKGGKEGKGIGKEFLSQYVSGMLWRRPDSAYPTDRSRLQHLPDATSA